MNTKTIKSKLDKISYDESQNSSYEVYPLDEEEMTISLGNIELGLDEVISIFHSLPSDMSTKKNIRFIAKYLPIMHEKLTLVIGDINDMQEIIEDRY